MAVSRPEWEKATNFESAAALILGDLRSRVGLESWVVSRRDGDDQVILSALDDRFGIDADTTYPWESSFCSRVVDGRAPGVAPDVSQVPAFVEARALSGIDASSYATVPIPSPDGETLGMLCAFGSRVDPDIAGSLPVIELQAKVLGIVLSHELHLAEEVRRAERAEEAAHVDPLTRVGNRRAWDSAMAAEESRATRFGTTASIVILDLDGLKQINDLWGHDAGDRVLAKTAEELRARLRSVDMVARLGGDEFGILLPQTSESAAEALAGEVLDRLAGVGIAASAGVAQRKADSGLMGAWRAADTLMYGNKKGGRMPLAEHGDLPGLPPNPASVNPFEGVNAVLTLVLKQLSMDVAFVKRFDGDVSYFRNMLGAGEATVDPTVPVPLDGSLCKLIVDGELGEVTPDTSLSALVRHLPVVTEANIGSYVGIPLRHEDGQLYGTLCTLSADAKPDLNEKDAQVLRSLGEVVMRLIDIEENQDQERHSFLRRMDDVIDAGGPDVVYQPIHDLETLQVMGFEALSRFPAGSPTPAEWFTQATSHGAGPALEFAALKSALSTLPALRGNISLNISPATILLPEFLRIFADVPLERFVLEITEHEAIADYESVASVLRPLRARGLKIAVDDAGAGFASMHHILALVPDFIKLDISLTRGIDTHPARQALAASLVAFGAQTGATLIAEGIETLDELMCLRQLQIQYGQGYHLSRPSPAVDQWAAST